jgi:hypothetical protein
MLGEAPVIEQRPHPNGAAGAKISFEKTCERIRKDYTDPLVVAFARRTLNDNRQAKTTAQKCQVMLDTLRAKARYTLDPILSEYVASARLILCLDSTQKDYCHAGADCEELSATLCSLLMAVGIECKLIGQSFTSSGVPSHVLIAAFAPESETWLRMDPSTSLPVGRSHPATSEVEVDPHTGLVPDFSGPDPTATFVGVGALPGTLGLTLPGEVIAYRQLWDAYVVATANALYACAQRSPPARSNLTQAEFSDVYNGFGQSLISSWNQHANSSDWQILVYANDYLQDFAQVVVSVGNFYRPQLLLACPDIPLPPLPDVNDQSVVVSALESAKIVTVGSLQLLGIGAGGAIEYVDKTGKAVANVVQTTVNYIPWLVGGVIALSGAFIVKELVVAQRLAATPPKVVSRPAVKLPAHRRHVQLRRRPV